MKDVFPLSTQEVMFIDVSSKIIKNKSILNIKKFQNVKPIVKASVKNKRNSRLKHKEKGEIS